MVSRRVIHLLLNARVSRFRLTGIRNIDMNSTTLTLCAKSTERSGEAMRAWYLKFMGLVLWSLFLFAPFIAKADEGFTTILPFQSNQAESKVTESGFDLGGINMQLGNRDVFDKKIEGKWSLQFNAGKQTVLTDDFSTKIQHDRIQLDDGERESLRFGLGLNYTF